MAKKELLQKLFGMSPDKIITDALIFEEPEKTEWQMAASQLNDGLSKNQAWAMCQALQPMLRAGGAVMVRMRTNGKKRPATELQGLFSQNTNKMDMTRGLALILCTPTNLQHYVDRLTAKQRELWLRMLDCLYLTEREAKRILDTDHLTVKEKQRGYYYYATEKIDPPELMFFDMVRSPSAEVRRYGFREYETFISLPAPIYSFFLHVFRPETQEEGWYTRNELPKDHAVFNFEADSIIKHPLLQGLLEAGKLNMKLKGMSLTEVKRVGKSMGMPEIFGNDAIKGSNQELLRTRYYIEPLSLDYHIFRLRAETHEPYNYILRRIFSASFNRLCYYLPSLLFPHIKGLRRNFLEDNKLCEMLKDFNQLLKLHPDSWISIPDALQETLCEPDSKNLASYDQLVFNPSYISDSHDLTNLFSQKDIAVDTFVTEFGLTAIQAYSLMLCSLGMAEVALSPLNHPESPFARAEFIRLTNLGRYVLNISKTYEPPHIEQKAFFELDSERLIIRSLVNPNPYEQLLKDSSVAISKNRYETSASSFLAHCKNREDVEKNISIFRQFISSDLPPLWKQFFDQLLQHCNPLEKDATAYQHFRLSPDNADLIRLLTTDEKLRQLIIRAEDYRILVKNSDLNKFEERLKKHGYLL